MQLSLLLPLLITSSLLCAQIPDNFEFLDHDKPYSNLGPHELLDSSLLYVSHNATWPMIEVSLAISNNEKIKLYESYYSGQTKIQTLQDSIHNIFLYALVDYDIGIPGFIHAQYINGVTTVNEFFGPVPDNYDYKYFSADVISDADQNIYMSSFEVDSVYIINQQNIQAIPAPSSMKLFYHPLDSIVTLNGSQLLAFTGNKFEERDFAINVQNIIDMKFENNLEFVLTDSSLVVFSDFFSNFINEIFLPNDIKGFDQLDLKSYPKLTWLYFDDNKTYLEELDSSQNIQLLWEENIDTSHFSAFKNLDEGRFLLTGAYGVSSLRHNYFKSITPDSIVNYEGTALALEKFSLMRTSKDTIDVVTDINGDTVHISYQYFYDASLEFRNNSMDTLNYYDIYSNTYFGFGFALYLLFEYSNNDVLAPLESLTIDTSFVSYRFSADSLQLYALGANYKVNRDPNWKILSDFTSSNFNLQIQDKAFDVFPNPSSDLIQWDLIGESISAFAIFDNSGQVVFTSSCFNCRNVDISALSNGLYFLTLVSDKGEYFNTKFIKH